MSLNTETLNTILAPYIRSLTDGKTAENGVWEAINCFGTNWDIDAVDFPAMFAQATQQARAVMDTPALQPIGGMQALMMRPTEVELVRECFRWLFNDDDGDLKNARAAWKCLPTRSTAVSAVACRAWPSSLRRPAAPRCT